MWDRGGEYGCINYRNVRLCKRMLCKGSSMPAQCLFLMDNSTEEKFARCSYWNYLKWTYGLRFVNSEGICCSGRVLGLRYNETFKMNVITKRTQELLNRICASIVNVASDNFRINQIQVAAMFIGFQSLLRHFTWILKVFSSSVKARSVEKEKGNSWN